MKPLTDAALVVLPAVACLGLFVVGLSIAYSPLVGCAYLVGLVAYCRMVSRAPEEVAECLVALPCVAMVVLHIQLGIVVLAC